MSCRVSVVVPAYNGEQFIEECIQSVLDQDFQDFELIVVNDGSKDATSEIVENFAARDARVQLLHHEGRVNLGVSKSRKLGVQSSKGEWIAFLDADDQYLPSKLSRQVALAEASRNIVLSHTGVFYGEDLENSKSSNVWTHRAEELGEYNFSKRDDFLQRNPICLSTTMVRRKVLLEMNLGYPQMFQVEDWVMCVLLSAKGNFLAIPEPLSFYRKHASQFMAGFSSDPLIKNFGGLEMCLALATRVECEDTRKKIRSRIGVLLHELAQCYSSNGLASDAQILFDRSSETDYWKQRAIKAENSWRKLFPRIARKIADKIPRFSKR